MTETRKIKQLNDRQTAYSIHHHGQEVERVIVSHSRMDRSFLEAPWEADSYEDVRDTVIFNDEGKPGLGEVLYEHPGHIDHDQAILEYVEGKYHD